MLPISENEPANKEEKSAIEGRRQIRISVEIPYRNVTRKGALPNTFRLSGEGDLVIVVDKRNAKALFGEEIKDLVEKMM
ncbi:hypothetical protein BC937DRAFT_91227 [Endogone sp. FLAS-F59071]|nr:hypothetical protein BC937DRAFT_91227 [Endogone sp. FLAS-F59071]|eukprot:RUS21876.1 hypothetical protein BC937DRAFT_91227 [Endogone sp. FLAS-F59071]